MDNSHSNDQTNEDVFLLDRDQPAQLGQRPGTPPPNYNLINTAQHTITYEIIKTEDIHVVLVHEQPLVNAINVENEQGVIRKFTKENPVIPDDEFVSPIRRFNPADRYSPNSTVSSPMSSYSSSEGYWSGSDWDLDSSWRSYDSMRDDLPNLFDTPIRSIYQFLLPDETAHRSRGLSQPQLSCETCHTISAVYEEGNCN